MFGLFAFIDYNHIIFFLHQSFYFNFHKFKIYIQDELKLSFNDNVFLNNYILIVYNIYFLSEIFKSTLK